MEVIYVGNSIVTSDGRKAIKYVIYEDNVKNVARGCEIHRILNEQGFPTCQIYGYSRHFNSIDLEIDGKLWEVYAIIEFEYLNYRTLEESFKLGLSPKDRFYISLQFLNTMKMLHSMGFVHNDIYPVNILISPEGECYLIDFDDSTDKPTERDFGWDISKTKEILTMLYYNMDFGLTERYVDSGKSIFSANKTLNQLESTIKAIGSSYK